MRTIYKYELKTTDVNHIEINRDAQILSVQVQNGVPCIWALIDTEKETKEKVFEIFGTGHEVPEGMGISRNYIGTYQLMEGLLVFHVFEYTGV